jgi:outer membrane protein, heavy metal efflux system
MRQRLPRHRFSGVLLVALAACARYVPQPVDPAAHQAAYRARRLDDTALVSWVGRFAELPAAGRWTDRQLALAALRFRAELVRARAQWRTAVAAERTAGARPVPGAQADVERAVAGNTDESPWVVSLAALATVELGGKRGARLQRARARTTVAEGELRLTAWRIVQRTRAAAAALVSAEAGLGQARREAEAVRDVQLLERGRYQEASLGSAELARTGAELEAARAQVSAAAGAVLGARAELAGALALPAAAIETLAITPVRSAGCTLLDSAIVDSMAVLSLTRRPELARALAEYAVAEADVRLEVARQRPDLELGPGFIFDQGIKRWTLGLALPGLLGFRNRAPIVEAEAARAAAAARVAESQDSLLAEVDAAAAGCRAAVLERTAADSQVAVAGHAAELARAAYGRGETTRLEPALAALTFVRAERSRQSAEARLLTAGQSLEAALGAWGSGPGQRWPDVRATEDLEGAGR